MPVWPSALVRGTETAVQAVPQEARRTRLILFVCSPQRQTFVLSRGFPLSCIPAVVMQKASQRPNSTENADNADNTEIVQPPYFLRFVIRMRKMQEGLAVDGVCSEPVSSSDSLLTGKNTGKIANSSSESGYEVPVWC